MSTSSRPSATAPVPLTISAPSAANPPPPDPIPPEKEKLLFNAFFDASEPLVEIARHFDISVSTLAKWAAQPHIRAQLLDIAELGRMRTHMLAAERGSRAIHTLDCVSMFHQGDLEDSAQTGPIARRRDVSRKSAMDTLRIGLKDIREQFSLEEPLSERTRTTRKLKDARTDHAFPSDHQPLLQRLLRPRTAAEQLLNLAGGTGGMGGTGLALQTSASEIPAPRNSHPP
jgi:hypothetical protein